MVGHSSLLLKGQRNRWCCFDICDMYKMYSGSLIAIHTRPQSPWYDQSCSIHLLLYADNSKCERSRNDSPISSEWKTRDGQTDERLGCIALMAPSAGVINTISQTHQLLSPSVCRQRNGAGLISIHDTWQFGWYLAPTLGVWSCRPICLYLELSSYCNLSSIISLMLFLNLHLCSAETWTFKC